MEEFKVLKQALEMSVQKGVFTMQEVVVINQCLESVGKSIEQTDEKQIEE